MCSPPIKVVHSQAWQPKNPNPPRIVKDIQITTPRLFSRCPSCTALIMVKELKRRTNVISVTKRSGLFAPKNGNVLKTKSGTGQDGLLNLRVPYAIRKPANVNASDNRKYHIISL